MSDTRLHGMGESKLSREKVNLLGKYISSVKHSTGTTNTRKEAIAKEWKQKLKAQNPGGEQENRPGQKPGDSLSSGLARPEEKGQCWCDWRSSFSEGQGDRYLMRHFH